MGVIFITFLKCYYTFPKRGSELDDDTTSPEFTPQGRCSWATLSCQGLPPRHRLQHQITRQLGYYLNFLSSAPCKTYAAREVSCIYHLQVSCRKKRRFLFQAQDAPELACQILLEDSAWSILLQCSTLALLYYHSNACSSFTNWLYVQSIYSYARWCRTFARDPRPLLKFLPDRVGLIHLYPSQIEGCFLRRCVLIWTESTQTNALQRNLSLIFQRQCIKCLNIVIYVYWEWTAQLGISRQLEP